ncbi:unnamed protein product [Cuscuta epithymum]|uniref:Reverse transcriptase zinc-binding domain-containing protein n=1 Tax=Cuscuta epithymum TaxID=186058 RepID=A0AAV0D3J9_9ASTE|nr:unnamed protein product [Cuscuta epithymum]
MWDWIPPDGVSPLFSKLIKIMEALSTLLGGKSGIISTLNNIYTNGKLQSNKVYDILRVKGHSKPWMNLIWKNYIPPKFSFILWLGLRNRLPTCDNLLYIDMDRACCFCKTYMDSSDHLFFKCVFTRAIWEGVRQWLKIKKNSSTLLSTVKLCLKQYGGARLTSKAVRLALCCTVYLIWKARNEQIFGHKDATIEGVLFQIKLHVYRVLFRLYPVSMIEFLFSFF